MVKTQNWEMVCGKVNNSCYVSHPLITGLMESQREFFLWHHWSLQLGFPLSFKQDEFLKERALH